MAENRCPICKKRLSGQAQQDSKHLPFCSERCQMVDLGHWLSNNYAIPGEEIGRDDEPKTPEDR